MAWYLGIDTSNYTTSAALYDSEGGAVSQQKQLLPIKEGELGLRQSDAVFAHVKQLGRLVEALFEGGPVPLAGVGVSVRPRDAEGSYMPCFLVGEVAAQSIGAACGAPLTRVSHQSGHIAAALFSAGRLDLIGKRFAAFHLSGGTTEGLIAGPGGECGFTVELFARSLDLKAGQAVDRVGGMLGLKFPAGRELEQLASRSEKTYQVRPVMKGPDCSLSGIENRCQKMKLDGEADCDIARYCLDSILAALCGMTEAVRAQFGDIPILYAGGVMSNSIIREAVTSRYGGFFADPRFSTDNAAGVAVLASLAGRGDTAC